MESPSGEIKLFVGSQIFTCQKTDICKRSEYFYAMFTNEFSEKDKEEIVLNDVDETAFDFILKKKTLDNGVHFDLISDVLKVATMLQFNKETEQYEKYIITSDYLVRKPLPIMAVSFLIGRSHLQKKALAYCLWNFNELKFSNDFLNLSFQDLLKYLDDVHLHIEKELDVFEAIKIWVNHNIPSDGDIISLLTTLRFKSLTSSDLEEIQRTPFINKVEFTNKVFSHLRSDEFRSENTSNDLDKCIDKSDKELNNQNLDNIDEDVLNAVNELGMKMPRIYPGIPSIIIHKTDDFPALYEFKQDKLNLVVTFTEKPFSKAFVGFRMVTIGFKIYLFGGKEGFGNGMFNIEVWSYDLIGETFNFESTMLQQRRHFFITGFNEWIFVLGGTGKHRKVLDNIEKYNVNTRQWSDCIGLNKKTIEAVCSYNEKIYIASRIIYVYQPLNNKLESINIDLPAHGVSFISIQSYKSKDFLYAIDRKDANIYRWELLSNSSSEYLGKFIKNGENLFLNNYIYNVSCQERDNSIFIEKFCIRTFHITTVQLDNDMGYFESKHNGFFKIPYCL